MVAVQKQCHVGRSWLHKSQCSHDNRCNESVRWYHPRYGDQHHFSLRNHVILRVPDLRSIGSLRQDFADHASTLTPCFFTGDGEKALTQMPGEVQAQFVGVSKRPRFWHECNVVRRRSREGAFHVCPHEFCMVCVSDMLCSKGKGALSQHGTGRRTNCELGGHEKSIFTRKPMTKQTSTTMQA